MASTRNFDDIAQQFGTFENAADRWAHSEAPLLPGEPGAGTMVDVTPEIADMMARRKEARQAAWIAEHGQEAWDKLNSRR